MDVKVGDVVHVRGKVEQSSVFGYPFVAFDGAGPAICVKVADVVHVEPRPLPVICIGDKVRKGGNGSTAQVIGRDGDMLWVKWDLDGSRGTWHVSEFGGR
jgi:hypothetical protein